MRFALIDNLKVEASKGVRGFCQSCGAEVIAKCGEFKINHWAHKKKKDCDSWWETETEWHRNWKDNFPIDWQEIIQYDSITNEKHIADIKTDSGLVIEFQHSHIKPDERRSREAFYKNMIWVVDGTRLKRDFPRFFKEFWTDDGICDVHETKNKDIYTVSFPEWCFPKNWVESTVPVVFDFFGDGSSQILENLEHINYEIELSELRALRKPLYCLFPNNYFAVISRSSFFEACSNGTWTKRVQDFLIKKAQERKIQEEKNRLEYLRMQAYYAKRRIMRRNSRKRRRRF